MKQIYNLIVLLACFFFTSCEKDTEPEQLAPSVELLELTDMSRTVVTLHGKLDASDLNSIEEVGFKVGKASDLSDAQLYPAKDFKENLEDVSAEVRGLEVGGTYFYAMYVSNGISLSSSEIQAFTTLTNSPPYPSEVTKADSTRAYFTAKIVDNGGAPVTTKGFCWSTKTKPTIFDSFKVIESSGDDMEIVVPEMKSGITYYIRTFAENANGFTYSKEVKFQLPSPGIYKLKDLLAFRDAVNSGESIDQWLDKEGTVNLFADIDLASVENWIPISRIDEGVIFDGNGFTVSNMKINMDGLKVDRVGFIGMNQSIIRNLTIGKGSIIKGVNDVKADCVGGLCGISWDKIESCVSYCQVELKNMDSDQIKVGIVGGLCGSGAFFIDCYSYGNVIVDAKDAFVGGLVGHGSKMENCINRGDVKGLWCTGGIAGACSTEMGTYLKNCKNYGTIIGAGNACQGIGFGVKYMNACINYGSISGEANWISGVGSVYDLDGKETIQENCVNEGNVTGTGFVGGVSSHVDLGAIVRNCLNRGTVTGESNTSGIAAIVDGTVFACENAGAVIGGPYSGGIVGRIEKTGVVTKCIYGGTLNGTAVTKNNAVGDIMLGGVFEP